MECEIIDSVSFKNPRGVRVYESFLNMSVEQSIGWSFLKLEPTYTATFKENDPYAAMAAGKQATTAAFQQKVDGGMFANIQCDFVGATTLLNVEPVKKYNYVLDTLQTKTSPAPEPREVQSINNKKFQTTGDLVCRNTLSNKILTIDKFLPSLSRYPTIVNNIIDYEIVLDTVLLYTSESIYIERYNYDFQTGSTVSSTVSPVVVTRYDAPTSVLSKNFFNESTKKITIARSKSLDYNNGLFMEMMQYDLETGEYEMLYDESHASAKNIQDMKLPKGLYGNYTINKVGNAILCFNDILQQYTVVTTANLATTYTGTVTGEYAKNVFCLLLYNYNVTTSGLKYTGSIIYHPKNKREYRYDDSINKITVTLSAGEEIINIGTPIANNTRVTIDPINLPVRTSKIKEIVYRYDDKVERQTRAVVNDPVRVGISDFTLLRDSGLSVISGGPIDFACPKYVKKIIQPDTNSSSVSLIDIEITVIYYDGFTYDFRILGESRPRPVDYLFKNIELISATAYTSENRPNAIRVTLETQRPKHILEYVIDNNTSLPDVSYSEYKFDTPVLSTTNLSGLSALLSSVNEER